MGSEPLGKFSTLVDSPTSYEHTDSSRHDPICLVLNMKLLRSYYSGRRLANLYLGTAEVSCRFSRAKQKGAINWVFKHLGIRADPGCIDRERIGRQCFSAPQVWRSSRMFSSSVRLDSSYERLSGTIRVHGFGFSAGVY